MRASGSTNRPLGAAALAGTAFPIDRDMTAKALGFDRPMANSLDAVSDRDFVLETLAAAAITAVHLSRFAEEIVIWCSPLVGLVLLSDRFTTGSSIMPQKRNPDAAELVRAKTGRIIGALQALLIVMKGLPLAYQKDMQEDKEGAMDALSALTLSIAAMTGMVRDMLPDAARMRKAADEGYSTATDLADWLVRTLKMPFRDAHHVTGRIVAKAASDGVALHELPLHAMQAIEPRITKDVFEVLSVDNSVKSRVSYGGTAPEERAPGGQPMAQGAGPRRLTDGFGNPQFRHALASVACYGARTSGGVGLIEFSDQQLGPSRGRGRARRRARLSACGRKGGLDPPPYASAQQRQLAGQPPADPAPAAREARRRRPRRQGGRHRCARNRRDRPFHPRLARRLSHRRALPCTISTIAPACCTPRRSISPSSRTRSARRSIAIRPRRSSATTACSPAPSPT